MVLRRLDKSRLPALCAFAATAAASAGVAIPGIRAETSSDIMTSAQVVKLLDGFVQRRFLEDNGKFGLMRLPPPVSGHDTVQYKLHAQDSGEKEVIRAVNAFEYEYLVEFLHCKHVPGRKQDPPAEPEKEGVKSITLVAAKSASTPFAPYSFPKERKQFRTDTEEPILKQAGSIFGRLAKGAAVDTTVGTWQVSFRPVRASKQSCLNCHAGARMGDTLGVMAYAVRQLPKSETGQSVSSASQP